MTTTVPASDVVTIGAIMTAENGVVWPDATVGLIWTARYKSSDSANETSNRRYWH